MAMMLPPPPPPPPGLEDLQADDAWWPPPCDGDLVDQLFYDLSFALFLQGTALDLPTMDNGQSMMALGPRELAHVQLNDCGPHGGMDARSGAKLARKVRSSDATTLQCYGVHPHASLKEFVLALNAVGLRGCYNFVHVPRRMDGARTDGLGYAFVNFTSSSCAAWLVERWEGERHANTRLFAGRIRLKLAQQQGYQKYTTARCFRLYARVHNETLRPLVLTEDGRRAVFGVPEAIAVALSV